MGGAGRKQSGSIFNPGLAYNSPSTAPTGNQQGSYQPAQDQAMYRSIYDQVSAQYAPDMEFQRMLLNSTAQAQNRNFDQRSADANKDYSLGNRYIDLQDKGLGIDRGAANRDIAYYNQMLGNIPGYRNLSGRELTNTRGNLAAQGNMERIGINSDATAKGAWFSPMKGVKTYDSLMRQARGEEGAQIGFDRDALGLSEKEAGLKRSLGNSQDALSKLDIESQRLGLDREKLKNQLDSGLASLGYDRFVNTSDLLQRMASQNKAEADMAKKIFDEVIGLGNIPGLGYNGYFGG